MFIISVRVVFFNFSSGQIFWFERIRHFFIALCNVYLYFSFNYAKTVNVKMYIVQEWRLIGWFTLG